MMLALNLTILAFLIIAAGLGGYLLSQAKSTALLERRSAAYRAQITRLRRTAAKAEEESVKVSGDLDRARRRLRRYELALYNQAMVETPAAHAQAQPQTQALPDQTARYEAREIEPAAPSGHLDGEVLQDVKKTVDVDRFRVNFVRREIA